MSYASGTKSNSQFHLLSTVSSDPEGYTQVTKAMYVYAGCVVQVTTRQRNKDGSYSIAEALTFVPGVRIQTDAEGNRYLK